MITQEIIKIFESEFSPIADKFRVIDVKLSDLRESREECVFHPGVYVFCNSEKIIKVGRHLTNSRKRALEHIRDNTKFESWEMKDLESNEDIRVLLFNLKKPDDLHWAASVEIYLEKKLNPIIRSKRLG